MSLSVDGAWKAGVWAETVWADDLWREGEAPEKPVGEAKQTAAGHSRRHRYLVQIDGQDFEVSSVQEAVSLLDKARNLAETHARERIGRQVKRAKRRGKSVAELTVPMPELETDSIILEPIIDRTREAIAEVYQRVAREFELRELMRSKLADEDDEEAVVMLLLH